MPHDEYRAIADLYDHVVPYRTRTDIEFTSMPHANRAALFWNSDAARVVSCCPRRALESR